MDRENYEPNPNPNPIEFVKRVKSQTSQITNFIQKFKDKMYKLFKLNIYIHLKLDNKSYMYSL